jgi:hypothetical protein
MKKGAIIVITVLFFPCFLWAQGDKPVISVQPFIVRGLNPEEGRIIESLILSYIAIIGDIQTETGNREDALTGAAAEGRYNAGGTRLPDFIMLGSISLEGDDHILELKITNTLTGEITAYTSFHKTTGELLLKARSMAETLFSLDVVSPGDVPGEVREDSPETLTEGAVTGTWRGDTGIEIVRLRQGGRGIAIFSSGARMNLAYTIENDALTVVQSSPNTERFYYPVPFGVAKKLAAEAEPMRWEFLLYKRGTSLRGIKVTTAVRYEGDVVLELLPGTVRAAEWTRAAR